MKKLVLLVIAAMMGTNACTSSSSTSSSNGSDSGGEEASAESGSSSGSTEDSSGSSSGNGSDSGSGWDAGACRAGPSGDAAFSCPANDGSLGTSPPNTGSMGCNLCIEGCCGDRYCACARDSAVTDAGAPSGCLGYVACVQMCRFPQGDSGTDGGSLMQCGAQCAPAFAMSQVLEGDALLGCLTQSCATSMTCPNGW